MNLEPVAVSYAVSIFPPARQCKDIDTIALLERIWDINRAGHWAFRFWLDSGGNERCPFDGPDLLLGHSVPDKLFLAKMRNLFAKGLVRGCDCGCRGDYVVTEKGCDLIGRPFHGTMGY